MFAKYYFIPASASATNWKKFYSRWNFCFRHFGNLCVELASGKPFTKLAEVPFVDSRESIKFIKQLNVDNGNEKKNFFLFLCTKSLAEKFIINRLEIIFNNVLKFYELGVQQCHKVPHFCFVISLRSARASVRGGNFVGFNYNLLHGKYFINSETFY